MSSQATVTRQDVSFPSKTDTCAAWHWPAAPGAPLVILGHGFSATKEARLDAYGDRFAAAGYGVLAFDYRHFGGSTGEPRNLLDIEKQHEDWHAAVAYARTLDGVDPDRIAIWGTSFGGGHVLEIAADDPCIAAVISQVPHTDGKATMGTMKPVVRYGARAVGWIDRAGARLGRDPIYVPKKGGDDWARIAELYPEDHEAWSQVAARVFSHLPHYSPGKRAPEIQQPLLVQTAEKDPITPAAPARKVAETAPNAELRSYPIDHFGIYFGEPFERAVADQLEFLNRVVA